MNKKIKDYKVELEQEQQVNRIMKAELKELRTICAELNEKINAWKYDYDNLKKSYDELYNKTLKNRFKRTFLGRKLVALKHKLRG